MAETLTLARPYARAAFEYALAGHGLDSWSGKLALLAGLLNEEAVRLACREPASTADRRAEVLLELTGDLNDAAMSNFIRLLSRNGRLELLPEIHELFERQRAEHEQAIQVRAISAFPLSAEQLSTLTERLERRLSRKVQIAEEVDAGLIGGILIHAGDKVIDGSLRGRLDRLADSILS